MIRAIVLLLLATGGSLLPVAPTAAAQASPGAICFDHDPGFEGDQDGSQSGPCVASRPADYVEGAEVLIRVPQWAPATQSWMSVRCTKGCPSTDPAASHVYWVQYRGGNARFPADFIDAGPNNDGGNAVLDRAPRYNGTWTVTLHLPTPVVREFATWLYDAWSDDFGNYTVRPGATHTIHASGFDARGEINLRWERKDANSGRYFPFYSRTTTANEFGAFSMDFEFAKNESQRINACGGVFLDCYRIIMSGAGKQQEVVNVQVGLARIERSEGAQRQAPGDVPTLQRTSNVTASIDLYYPSGRLFNGPKFVSADAPLSVRHGGHALRVNVEKYFDVNTTVYLIDDVPLRYDAIALRWTVVWTIPRDMPIDSSANYRLRLPEQRDLYGNIVVEDALLNFTIEPAEILPTLVEPFGELERTREGIMRVAVLYHNGTPFTPADMKEGDASKLFGCFKRIPPPPPAPAPPANTEIPSCARNENTRITGTYYEGAWNFSVKYPRGYENLDRHRFILANDTVDKWDNQIWGQASEPYLVIPARPTVDISTVMRGAETDVIERGNRVTISATIKYHDGTPYNHFVRPFNQTSAAQALVGTLTRRGPAQNGAYGPIASEENFTLYETDSSQGHWTGYLQLTDDDTFTPVGIWTWKFEVADNLTTPNKNVSVFDREVVSSLIRVCPTYQPSASVPTGATLKFRFKLYYSQCDTGREVPSGALESQLAARVYRYNPQNLSAYGPPLSNAIIPSFARESSLDWGLEYVVPNSLFSGSYVFVLTGADSYGNKLVPSARSRPFSTFTEVVTRSVITQPQNSISRGDSATVVFDSREGDTGVDPLRPVPRIQLERFDTSSTDCPTAATEGGCWVRERADVRVPDPTLTDHMGVFPVGVDTPVGLYRFALQGRDRDFHIITGVSENFTVSATFVTRALLSTPPERVVKGEPFSFFVESLPGDDVRDRVAFFNGRPIIVSAPLLTHDRGRVNVTWSIPFEAPTGNYTLRISGRDVNGNVITILTPPIDAMPASLEGRVIGNPTKTIQRGEAARLQFGVGYPDGSFYASADEPRVFVVSAAGFSQPAAIRREGLSFAAVWTPNAESPIGEYYFEVSPQANGQTGNLFPPLRSNSFRVVPGAVFRPPIDDLGIEVERLSQAAFTTAFLPDDKFVGFELVYYGPSLSTAIDTTTPLLEVTRSPLPHTIDAASGKYVARLVTDHQTQTGTYKIVMSGEDAFGNAITSSSRQFVIMPTTIGVVYDPVPPADAFGEGKTITLSFVAKYRVGTIMDESFGRPSATLLYDAGGGFRPVTQRPDIEYRDGHWFMTWKAPEILPAGVYEFLVGGADVVGNPIATARSTPYIIAESTLIESATAVPGASPILGVLAIAAMAALVARRRSK